MNLLMKATKCFLAFLFISIINSCAAVSKSAYTGEDTPFILAFQETFGIDSSWRKRSHLVVSKNHRFEEVELEFLEGKGVGLIDDWENFLSKRQNNSSYILVDWIFDFSDGSFYNYVMRTTTQTGHFQSEIFVFKKSTLDQDRVQWKFIRRKQSVYGWGSQL